MPAPRSGLATFAWAQPFHGGQALVGKTDAGCFQGVAGGVQAGGVGQLVQLGGGRIAQLPWPQAHPALRRQLHMLAADGLGGENPP